MIRVAESEPHLGASSLTIAAAKEFLGDVADSHELRCAGWSLDESVRNHARIDLMSSSG